AMLGQSGFFTIDYEFVDYASSRFKFGTSIDEKDYQRFINDRIKSTFQSASNIRMGVEIRLDNLMVRGGFGYYDNQYKKEITSILPGGPPSRINDINAQRLAFSGGIGFRFANAFLDLGFVHNRYKNSEQPYSLPDEAPYTGIIVPAAQLSTGANNAVLTLGFKM